MEVTYFTGKNNLRYCRITHKRGTKNYEVNGIPKQGLIDRKERLGLYIQIIARNFQITHTHLIRLAQEFTYHLAKKTVEDDLNYFEKNGLLESEKLGNSKNSLRVWSVYRPEHDFEKIAKREAKKIVTSLEQYVSTIEKIFKKLNRVNKDYALTYLFDIVHNWQPIIEIINQDVKINNEKKKFDSLANRAYQLLQHENRDYIDGRPLLRRLLHLKASEPMMNMNTFLDEIK